MNDVLARATCDFEDHAPRRQDITKDIKNEIAITQCCRRMLVVVAHLPHSFPELRRQDSLLRKTRRCRRVRPVGVAAASLVGLEIHRDLLVSKNHGVHDAPRR
jgi:hypothetical protein